ncbi:MAG TPA: VOC family protein [Candidatus Limnocylindria bacterium]
MIRQLDHVVLVVLDLERAVSEWRSRGFTVTPGGEHAGGLTHNALVGFADGSYVELIAFHDIAAARGKHQWQPVAERGGGWADFALLSGDLAADAKTLGALVAKPVEDGGRTRPDGVTLKWRTARLAPPLPFLIEDVTDRALRVPGGVAAAHANGAAGIVRVVVGSTDPLALRSNYNALRSIGAPPVTLQVGDRDGVADVIFR